MSVVRALIFSEGYMPLFLVFFLLLLPLDLLGQEADVQTKKAGVVAYKVQVPASQTIAPYSPIPSVQKQAQLPDDAIEKQASTLNDRLYAAIKPGIEAEDPASMFYYGIILMRKNQFEEAWEWIKKSAKAGNKDAIEYLKPRPLGFEAGMAALIQGKRKEAFDNFLYAAHQGDVKAQFHVALLLTEDGDEVAAQEWLNKAALSGDDRARTVLNMMRWQKESGRIEDFPGAP